MADTDPPPLTEEEAAAMRAQLQEYDAAQAAAAAAARAAQLQPVTDMFASDYWIAFRAAIPDVARQMVDESFYDQLRALDQCSANLPDLVAQSAPPAADPAP